MPYQDVADLPESVREHLPKHAQEIYRAAFNSAWEEYHHDESKAHAVAWAAVEKKFHRNQKSGEWEQGGKV